MIMIAESSQRLPISFLSIQYSSGRLKTAFINYFMNKPENLDKKKLVFINQQWTKEEKKLFSSFLNWQKQISDFWVMLTLEQQQEILYATAEIEREEITDYETFMAKHKS